MRAQKQDLPVKIDVPGAVARQLEDFGNASGTMGAEYFTLAAGTDLAPLLVGLDDDACDSPHWGYVIAGRVVVTYRDAPPDVCVTGDVFYWPGGHSVRVEEDAELVLFSPQVLHGPVMDHILNRMATG